jgi:hypothetical protein
VSIYFLVRESLFGYSPYSILSLQSTVIDLEDVFKYLVDFEHFMDLLDFLRGACLLSACVTLFESLL